MAKTLVVSLLLICSPLLAQPSFDNWEELPSVVVQQDPGATCPGGFWYPFISEVNGVPYIRSNKNRCPYTWQEILSLETGQLGPELQPFPDSESNMKQDAGHPGIAVDCHTGGQTYSTGPSSIGLWCLGVPVWPVSPEGQIWNAGQIGGYLTEIPPEHRDALGGTHIAARGTWNQRVTYGSSIGPGAIVLDLSSPANTSPLGYKLFWSDVDEITPPLDPDDWPGVNIQRNRDARVGGCAFVDDSIVCVGAIFFGDWYGVANPYCRDDYDPVNNKHGDCLPGSTPTLHPISGEPMFYSCVSPSHKGRRATSVRSAIWVYDLEGNQLEENVLEEGEDACGTSSDGSFLGVTFDEASRTLAIAEADKGNPVKLRRWFIPSGTQPNASLNLTVGGVVVYTGECSGNLELTVDGTVVYSGDC